MIFTTYWFVAFAAIVFPLYWLLPWRAGRLALLLAACAVFHGHFAGAAGVVPIVVLGVAAYFAGRSGRGAWCLAVIVACAAALLGYKYSDFAARSILGLFDAQLGERASHWVRTVLPAAPPLAISFFTFEFVHYLFPGPIKRCGDFLPSLHRAVGEVCWNDVAMGASRVALGYFKKVVVSDNLAAWIAYYGPRFSSEPIWMRWLIFAAIAFRILLDFSGYSDIAIGLARMFGVTLPENFRWPYLSRNIQEFWQRWHISLSTWIRDYLYIPLGGSRLGVGRKIVNGFIVFALCGLWHGAAWNFILWGVYHGAGLAISGNYRLLPGRLGSGMGMFFDRFPPISWAITTAFVWTGWLLFFYPLPQAWKMAVGLFVK